MFDVEAQAGTPAAVAHLGGFYGLTVLEPHRFIVLGEFDMYCSLS